VPRGGGPHVEPPQAAGQRRPHRARTIEPAHRYCWLQPCGIGALEMDASPVAPK
jgi:hypothetical protein